VIGESDKPDLSLLGKKARRRARHDDSKAKGNESSDDSDDENVAPPSDDEAEPEPKQKKIKLSEEELALGQMMVSSKKTKRDLVDGAWNRYMFNDDNLPDWFVEDEKKSMKRTLPVSEQLVESYRKNLTEFNTRSIKKVMEAKARKKRQNKRKMEKITKKAEQIMENSDQTGQEKVKLLKKLYKKNENKKTEVTYVVAKKTGIAGRKVSRPAGVKGRFKVVDPRLKKDIRGEHTAKRTRRGKVSKGGKSGTGNGAKMPMKSKGGKAGVRGKSGGGRSGGKSGGKAGGKQKRK
jgi:AdoMet-dependent rRNA methyltransferase SPB1